MKEIYKYIIKGEPIALLRPRMNSEQRRVYDSQRSLKQLVGIGLRSQHDDRPLLSGPLHLNITFYMTVPPHSKRKTLHHCFKPDLDNLIKWICDISNGNLFVDDAGVSRITALKVYDDNPRTEFTLDRIVDVL